MEFKSVLQLSMWAEIKNSALIKYLYTDQLQAIYPQK